MPELTVVIPTYNRAAVLLVTLRRLDAQVGDAKFEAIIVDDGSTDDTLEEVRAHAARASYELRVVTQQNRGPAAARNVGIRAARSAVCLFIGDDTWPSPTLLECHARFHRARPERQAALVGHVEWARELEPTPFMTWASRVHESFSEIEDINHVPARFFFTGNVSVKTALLQEVGGFYEGFPYPAFEDIDLGLRLECVGMQLAYDEAATIGHYHPMGLRSEISRMRTVALSARILGNRYPEWPVPRRPGPRHRLKAAVLLALARLRQPGESLREEMWRFLCHEAYREAYWGRAPAGPQTLRVGERLLYLAESDPAVAEPVATVA